MMTSETLPGELAGLCIARLGLPLLIFDSAETLVHCNAAAARIVPACSKAHSIDDQLLAKDVFESSAADSLDFATAKILSTAGVSAFSLDRLLAEHAEKASNASLGGSSTFSTSSWDQAMEEQEWGHDQQQGAECQAYLKTAKDPVKTRWWQASISSFFASDDRSHYFCVLLIQAISTPQPQRLIPPEENSHSSSLERPPLVRKQSDKIAGPASLDDIVNDSTLAQAIDPEFYKTAVENMSEILFISATTGVVTYLNNQWYKYVGWDPKDINNREKWSEVFHPDDVQLAVEAYGASVRTGDDIRLQYRVKRADGVHRWMIARGRPVKDESGKVMSFVSTLTDAEDLVNARHEAIQARQHISAVLRAAAIALIVVDPEEKIMMCDGYEMTGDSLGLATAEDPVGKPLGQFWPDKRCVAHVQATLARWTSSDGTAVLAERDFVTEDGNSHFRYRISPLYHPADTKDTKDAHKVAALAIICTNITAMVQAELALQQSKLEREALVASEEAAKEASRLKTVFVTSLSHEIRTPLSGLLGTSELLLADATLSERQRSLVAKQLQAGELLLKLVSMVLDIGKMEANKLEVEKSPFLLTDLLSDMDIFSGLAEAKGLYFRSELQSPSNEFLLGDRLRIVQVLSNFLNNSLKFTPKGGITLQISTEDLGSQCLVTCDVIDTGIGIAAETLPQLFKPFHQASVSTAREYGGSGLGLTISKQLVELMGGTIELRSQLGAGSVASLRIPLAKGALATPRKAPTSLNGMVRTRSINRAECSILIAEDNRLLQEVYAALVRKMGFTRITVADDGQHALDCLTEHDYDVILMDCEMPRLSGPDAVAQIRNHSRPAVRQAKVIALTANAVAGDRERFLSLRFDKYLPKPVRASTLESTILECLGADVGTENGSSHSAELGSQ